MITYDEAVDEMFGIVKGVLDASGAAILGYAPDTRWPGVPEPNIPDRTKLWSRVSSKIVTDAQASLANFEGTRFFLVTGILYVQLFCPRNQAASVPNGILLAEAVQSQFRAANASQEIWYRDAKFVQLPENDESYPVMFSVQYQFKSVAT